MSEIPYECKQLPSGWSKLGFSCFYANSYSRTWFAANRESCSPSRIQNTRPFSADNLLLAGNLSLNVPNGLYWTGLRYIDLIRNNLEATNLSSSDCIVLSISSIGSSWVPSDCSRLLPTICQTFSCFSGEFRCSDNSYCLPSSAVGDMVADCDDLSDEAPNTIRDYRNSSCRDIHLSASSGSLSTPGYPVSYPFNCQCKWSIEAPEGKIIVITFESISISAEDVLLLSGNNVTDRYSFTGGQTAHSLITSSNKLTIRFETHSWRTAKGFALNYYAVDVAPCRIIDNTIEYNSYNTPFDCQYNLLIPQDYNHNSYIFLMSELSSLSSDASVDVIRSNDVAYSFKSTNYSQGLVLPVNVATLRINNAWLSNDVTHIRFRIFYLDNVSRPINFAGDGLAVHWPSETPPLSREMDHILSIRMKGSEGYTWGIDRINRTAIDSVKITMDNLTSGEVWRTGYYRNNRNTVLKIIKRSRIFSTSIKFSRDCPPLQPIEASVNTAWRHLGVCATFSCPNKNLTVITQCLVGGVWSDNEPKCYEDLTTASTTLPLESTTDPILIECALQCQNGYCSNQEDNNEEYCSCYEGFTGVLCEQKIVAACDSFTCENGGSCNESPQHGVYCNCEAGFTGERCEQVIGNSWNLLFTGEPSSQRIVSRMLNTSLYREFTLCGWVNYNSANNSAAFMGIMTSAGQSVISVDGYGVTLDDLRFLKMDLSSMQWHHICVRSPEYYSEEKFIWSLFVDGVFIMNATNTILPQNNRTLYILEVAPGGRLKGEVSLVQLYSSLLLDTEIYNMAYHCSNWTQGHPDLIINWRDFTKVEVFNRGVKTIYGGICNREDCLPASDYCGSTDKTPPVVRSCPADIVVLAEPSSTAAVVNWSTPEFTDNVGVASVRSNIVPGPMNIGTYRVLYVASDYSGNTAQCIFTVTVTQNSRERTISEDNFIVDT